jgi:Flp pilus assembly CpaF family ATPase
MIGFETILPFLRPIEQLIRDDSISEIMVNGSTHVFIERDDVLQEVPDLTLSAKSLMVAVKNIAGRLGDDISEQKPILDSRLPDGSRVAAVIPRAAFTPSRSQSASSTVATSRCKIWSSAGA